MITNSIEDNPVSSLSITRTPEKTSQSVKKTLSPRTAIVPYQTPTILLFQQIFRGSGAGFRLRDGNLRRSDVSFVPEFGRQYLRKTIANETGTLSIGLLPLE